MKCKFTFKKASKSGKYSSFYPNRTALKIKGKVVGEIYQNDIAGKYKIQFAVNIPAVNNPNCQWSWRFFNKEFDTEKEAREWINSKEIIEYIFNKYDLHSFE